MRLMALLGILLVVAAGAAGVLLQRRVRRDREPGSAGFVREATLGAAEDGSWWCPLALLPLSLTAVVLAYRWAAVPRRFPIHWGMAGEANGWAERSVPSVFGPLVVAGLLVIGFTVLGEVIARYSPAHSGRAAPLRAARVALGASAWLVALLFCAFSGMTLVPNPRMVVPFVFAGSVCFSLGLVGYVVYRSMRMPEELRAAKRTTEDRFWRAGLIYYNPEDAALMVPKRDGFGYTMNFGRPGAWVILGGILLVPLALPLLMYVHGGR